jgi:hypothetical protein
MVQIEDVDHTHSFHTHQAPAATDLIVLGSAMPWVLRACTVTVVARKCSAGKALCVGAIAQSTHPHLVAQTDRVEGADLRAYWRRWCRTTGTPRHPSTCTDTPTDQRQGPWHTVRVTSSRGFLRRRSLFKRYQNDGIFRGGIELWRTTRNEVSHLTFNMCFYTVPVRHMTASVQRIGSR